MINEVSVEESTKLAMYSQFCEDLTTSLQFRDDILDDMAISVTDATKVCDNTFQNTPEIIGWWWDYKNITSYGNDTISMCEDWTAAMIEEEEYGNIKNVGTLAAIDR